MTNYLIDTNTITALANGNINAQQHLESIDQTDNIYTCFIVVAEWEYGILNAPGQNRQLNIRSAGQPVFALLTGVLESSPAVSLIYADIYFQLKSLGQMMPVNDIWIAAVAQAYNAVVVTTDPHFRRVAGLAVVDWTLP